MTNPLDVFTRAREYLKTIPGWPVIEPLFTLATLYATVVVLSVEFLNWQYKVTLPPSLFVKSYIFKQISIIFIAVGLAGTLIRRWTRKPKERRSAPVRHGYRPYGFRRTSVPRPSIAPPNHYSRLALRLAILAALAGLTTAAVFRIAPAQLNEIRIKMMTEPDFDSRAVTYLIYELNRMQKNWYFVVDFDTFNDAKLTSAERQQCESDENTSLCYAQMAAGGKPFVGITRDPLGQDHFFQNQGMVSVISTDGWKQYAPPSIYEYVLHSLIAQSILIHLNAEGPELPAGAFHESRTSAGELFQFSPRRQEMKATILAPRLTPQAQELLMNSFGVGYLSTCESLLSLEWLHSQRVRDNLGKGFGVKL